MARELSQRVHATRDYPVAEIIIFGMKWFDNPQNHLHAEGQDLFHLSLPLCTVLLETWVQQGQIDPLEIGKGTHK